MGMKRKSPPATEVIAREMAAQQKSISVAEFFTKNRHLLGFDNPRKALLTCVKEAVDNSLDACEEAGVLPEIAVRIEPLKEDGRFRMTVEDNGPGIVREQIPRIFGKLLYGSKFHRLKQSRGQQGIGISAAGMYGQLTTGKSTRILSRIGSRAPAHYFEIHVNTEKNTPEIVRDDALEWDKKHGTRVEIDMEGSYQKGRRSVDEYIQQTAIANPHVSFTYTSPAGETAKYARAIKEIPRQPDEIQPHPHGVELGVLIKMLKATRARRLKSFLQTEFSRVGTRVAREICAKAGLSEKAYPTRIAKGEADALFKAVNETKIMSPPTDCVSPIGEEEILKSLKKEIDADFYTAATRPPAVYRGNPFQIEVGLAYGGKQPAEGLARLMRFANRVPLLYQQSACAIAKGVLSTSWRNYGIQQARGALPTAPLTIMIHMASVWVPFTSESKEAVAHYPEILREIRLALQECGRRLSVFLKRRAREADARKKRDYIESYIPHVGIALREILDLKERQEKAIVKRLKQTLEKTRKI